MINDHKLIDELVAADRLAPEDAERLRAAMNEAGRRGAAKGIISWILLGLTVAACLAQAVILPPVLGTFAIMFREMELTEGLPGLTEALLSIPTWGYAVGFVLLAAGLVVKELTIKNRSVSLTINAAALIGLAVFKTLYIIALFLPMVSMMNQLSSQYNG